VFWDWNVRFNRLLIIGCVALSLIAVSAAIVVPDLRWRAKVSLRKAGGDLDEISWPRLLQMLSTGSGYQLKQVAEGGTSLHSVFRNPHNASEDIIAGERLFRSHCASCHLGHGATSSAPNLTDEVYEHGASDWAIFTSIANGIPGTAMQASTLDDIQIWQLVSYIRDASVNAVDNRHSPEPRRREIGLVDSGRLVNAEDEPENWVMYSGTYSGQRYSRLDEIETINAEHLEIDWVYQFETNQSIAQSTPLVIDGTMFLTISPDLDVAIDARAFK
jgi:mono/diheme cytochrome c family protein